MAAPGRHVGHYIQRNGRFLLCNIEQVLGHRSFGWTPAVRQQAAEVNQELPESIVIPKKKTWSKEAVLEALSSTVGRDPTACPYMFQDDPFLTPRTSTEFRMFALSQESGRDAAKFFINSNPKFFTKDFAEPHIPCLMPKTVSLVLEEVSEEALKERINLRKVSAAVDMYDQLLQAGTAVSMETTHGLLDLICFYCDKDPAEEEEPQREDTDSDEPKPKGRIHRASDFIKLTWKENNNAERIFNLLPERDTRCYSALIRGMVKYRAPAKAYSMYTDMLNNRVTGDVHIFNTLISSVVHLRVNYEARWELVTELLYQMNQQKIRPNILTFNSVLQTLRRCGPIGKSLSLQTVSEMKALGIAPSLATYEHILCLFHKPVAQKQYGADILQEIVSELEGTSLTCQDPNDVLFFATAMRVCVDTKELELGYKVHSLTEFGENYKLQGVPYQRSTYYGRFFNLLCMMEHVDAVLKWYRRLIPSLFYPNVQGMMDLLQCLDTDNRLDLLPDIWKDIKTVGHENKSEVVEEVLQLMAREKHSPEVQESFATCALDVKNEFEVKRLLQWSNLSLSNVTIVLLRANKTQMAWEMLELFKSYNRVPSKEVLDAFLTVCHSDGTPQKAVELVQAAAALCLLQTPTLATRTLAEFDLTEEQRAILTELEAAGEPSD
ncbi:small ribosomal subunit protein mS39 [Stegastes partitus]|nr:PREDICTED: pentatricopeptide repeat domain-containing protein 3, mitochondrial [Stegastes partitus]